MQMMVKVRVGMRRIMTPSLKWVEIGLEELGMEEVIEEMSPEAEMA